MSEMSEAILDVAEARMRSAGFDGVSFRDIAAEIGVKSASIHYHFPTKALLGAAVARRYRERFLARAEAEVAAGCDVVQAWTEGFRRALRQDGKMCLCGALGVTASGLPLEVGDEARQFFTDGLARLTAGGASPERAATVLATLEGAMLLATALRDPALFDVATACLSA